MLSRTTSYFACLAALVSALFIGGCAKPASSGGGVTCNSDQTACGSVCKNVQSDNQNCGACGTVCSSYFATSSCQSGTCHIDSCFPNWTDCDGNPLTGCECLGTTCNGTSCGV